MFYVPHGKGLGLAAQKKTLNTVIKNDAARKGAMCPSSLQLSTGASNNSELPCSLSD